MVVVKNIVLSADSKALATCGDEGINCVPVSTVDYIDGDIWLYDFFMERTRLNIESNPRCSLACWKAMKGIQIKGDAVYLSSGDLYDKALIIAQKKHPDRVLKGLIILKINSVYSVTPGDSSLLSINF